MYIPTLHSVLDVMKFHDRLSKLGLHSLFSHCRPLFQNSPVCYSIYKLWDVLANLNENNFHLTPQTLKSVKPLLSYDFVEKIPQLLIHIFYKQLLHKFAAITIVAMTIAISNTLGYRLICYISVYFGVRIICKLQQWSSIGNVHQDIYNREYWWFYLSFNF